jgi:hypothetical protein
LARCGSSAGREAAPAVLDLLFLGERVVDAREGAGVLAEDLGERVEGGLALCAVLLGEEVEGALDAQGLAVHLELERGDRLVEELVPGGGADDRGVVQEPLELVESW